MVKPLQNKLPAPSVEYAEDFGGDSMAGAQAPSIDLLGILLAVLRRWKLIASVTLAALIATYGVLKIVPSKYKSTVEILVYDPQRQIDATIQKPISPFVDAVGTDAINTEINLLKSKSVALRVASELGLDSDPEFLPDDGIVKRLAIIDWAKRLGVADWVKRLGFSGLGQAFDNSGQTIAETEDKAEKLDRAADELIDKLDIWQDSYIIHVSATSRDPIKAQRLASSIANDYLASQREARTEALEHVANWLKGRVEDAQSHLLQTQSAIEKLKAESGVRDTDFDNVREQQIGLNTQLMGAREEVNARRAQLEQTRHVLDTNGDIDSIPGVTASAMLGELRRKQMEMNLNLADLQNRFGEHNNQIITIRTQLTTVNKQINAEAEHILGIMKNAYDIAVRREQTLEANLQSLIARGYSETFTKLQQLRHVADTDSKAYQSYLSQYTEISERREMQVSSARIVSPASVPRSPSSNKLKAIGGMAGLGGGLLLAFLLEYFRPGLKTSIEIEQSFGLPVIGSIPLVRKARGASYPRPLVRKARGASYPRPLDRMVKEPLSHLSEAVHALRISLGLSNADQKVILITSALSGEGKSTAAMLLAASSASSGNRTVLLDCDLRLRSTSESLQKKNHPGLSEFLRGTAELEDVIIEHQETKIHVIPAGSLVPNAADLLMSQEMLNLIAELRHGFDYIVMDTPPLLPVVDALALATVAEKILLIVEWRRTPRASIYEALRVLGPQAHRVAGIVLNKVDFNELRGYGGGYRHRSIDKYFVSGLWVPPAAPRAHRRMSDSLN